RGSCVPWQAPRPLQVSALSHWLEEGSPHAVPTTLKPLSGQAPPPSHLSWLVHSVPVSPQLVPAATWLTWQAPLPLQVSALSHSLVAGLPHAVPTTLKPLSVQLPVPLQVSWLISSEHTSALQSPAAIW